MGVVTSIIPSPLSEVTGPASGSHPASLLRQWGPGSLVTGHTQASSEGHGAAQVIIAKLF